MKTSALILALASSCTALLEQQPLLSPTSSGVKDIPLNGFGTWNLKGENTSDVVAAAMVAGYRHIDAAKIYGNQKAVGLGLKDGAEKAGIRREDYWVTSKLWNNAHKPSQVPDALNETLTELGLDYLDLYLMHWPVGQDGKDNYEDFIDTWRAMSLLLATGTVRHIGVCNFSPSQFEALVKSTAGLVVPYSHQFEDHPYLNQSDFIATHAAHGVHVTAYSPFGNMNPTYASVEFPLLLKSPVVAKIAERRNCTPAQVVLKWNLDRDVAVIPKSAHVDRMEENFAATECELKDEDREDLANLPVKRFNNPSKSWGVHLFEGLQDSE